MASKANIDRTLRARAYLARQDTVLNAVQEERFKQDAQWGGPEHDDSRSLGDWIGFIEKQLKRVNTEQIVTYKAAKARFIKVAALAVAACESIVRKQTDGLIVKTNTKPKLTFSQWDWLKKLAAGDDPGTFLRGQSEYGGATRIVGSLTRRGLIDRHGQLTALGLASSKSGRDESAKENK